MLPIFQNLFLADIFEIKLPKENSFKTMIIKLTT